MKRFLPIIAALQTALFLCIPHAVLADEENEGLNIEPQPLASALREFSEQTGLQIGYAAELANGKKSKGVDGVDDPAVALDTLLASTGLEHRFVNDETVVIRAVPPLDTKRVETKPGKAQPASSQVLMAQNQTSAPQTETTGRSQITNNAKKDVIPLEEIIVTGTSIRGVTPESSPLEIYSAVDIRNTGALTAEQFIATLPQNNNTLTDVGGTSSPRETNLSSINSADLRGLGVGSTLVLLNGRRMAPSSGGRTADLSFIPIGAIERVEVLSDGASAIYGADAVGGVINFVLRDQQDGAETVLTFGGADGGSEQWRIDQSFGFNWADGNALIALNYTDRNSLDAADRDYATAAAPFTLIPEDTRTSVLATISQGFLKDTQISADILYSTRETATAQTQSQFGADDLLTNQSDHEQVVTNLKIDSSFAETINASLLMTYADASLDSKSFADGPTIGVGPSNSNEDSSSLDITAIVDGELARFSSGALMFALGAGYNEDEFASDSSSAINGNVDASSAKFDRSTKYAFAELLVPIVSSDQRISGIRRLELSLAARYTDYSDFGDATSPKIGILWSPVESLKIRGSFGESFKAPFLKDLDPNRATYGLFPVALIGATDIWSTDNSSVMLFANGAGNPSLGPEESETRSIGFDFDHSGLNVSATYFKIDYTDRIGEPDPTRVASLIGPQDFPEMFIVNPTLEEVTAVVSNATNTFNLTGIDPNDPASVHAGITVLADNRLRNLAITEMDGLDLRLEYATNSLGGELSFGLNASKIFDFEERSFASASPVSRVDTVLYPADLKARGHIGFGKERWNTRLNVNYVDEYENPFDPVNPRIDAWTTVDLLFSYEFPTDASGFSDGLRLGLTITNALDEDPPFVGVGPQAGLSLFVPTGFDPTNANPLGRFISIQLAKSW